MSSSHNRSAPPNGAAERPSHESDVGEELNTTIDTYDLQPDAEKGPTSREPTNALARSETSRSIADDMSPIREFFFVSIMCLCQFCTQAGLGVCLSTINVIGAHYDITNPGVLSWLIAGYSLTVGTFILVSGRLGDLFGYKRMLLIGFTWFTLWSLIAGVAHYSNHVLFIFARVLQGIGPSICVTNGLAILGATYCPSRKKDMIFAIFGATAPVGSIIGALFAAIFAQLAGAWWWAFYALAITLAVIGVTAFFVVPDPPRRLELTDSQQLPMWQQLDAPGAAVGLLALVLFNFAWNQAGVVSWASPYVCVCLVLGVLLVPVFFYIEKHVARAPLVPFDILTADVAFVLACVSCGWGSFGVWVYYLWQFALQIRHASPLLGSAWICPVAISGCSAAIMTGFLLSRIRAAWVMFFAMTAFLVGIILIGTAPAVQIYWGQFFFCTLVITFGMDMSFPASTVIVSNALPRNKQGVGASLVNTVVNYSISLALGFAGTVENQVRDGNTLKGYRGAFYMGFGLAGLGLCVSTVFLIRSYVKGDAQIKTEKHDDADEQNADDDHDDDDQDTTDRASVKKETEG